MAYMNKLFEKLASQENSFRETEFLAPVLLGQKIKIKISNIVMELDVKPKRFSGWGVFRSNDYRTAEFIRPAHELERGEYLKLFPSFRVIVFKRGDNFFGIPLPDSRFQITGEIPINLPIEIEQFDCVAVRYDGENCWFDSKIYDYMPHADYLREILSKEIPSEKLHFSGLLAEHVKAYNIVIKELQKLKELSISDKIKNAIHRGGGVYKSHKDLTDGFTITYNIGNRSYTSTVDKNLRVQSAGICLSGQDKKFDLQSLMSVILEGEQRNSIVIGNNFGYDEYDEDEDY